jgi:uncharacterized protein YcfL
MKKLLSIIIFSLAIYGCTSKQNARMWGGTETITLEKGSRLVNISWKENSSLWILTKKDTTAPTTYTFEERSNAGIFNGKVIINEE